MTFSPKHIFSYTLHLVGVIQLVLLLSLQNVSICWIVIELHCGYHLCNLFENNINFCPKFYLINYLAIKLDDLIIICENNLLNTQKPRKQSNDKEVKSHSYAPNEKI